MIELIQFPWSPYCLVQRQILEFGGISHHPVNIPPSDRSLVWQVTRRRYYQVPVIRQGRTVLFETGPDSQVIAKYLDVQFKLGLFPAEAAGLQDLLWRYIENEIEDCTFRLNDAYYLEFVPPAEQLNYVRWKERKFGRGCLKQWLDQQRELGAELARRLQPFEQMLSRRPFLLEARPRFVDFDLYGMLANLLYSGHPKLPRAHTRLGRWFRRMSKARLSDFNP